MPKVLLARWTLRLGLALAPATPASASHWWVVLQNDADGNSILADSDSIEHVGGERRAMLMHRFYREVKNGMASAAIQYEIDCAKGSVRERRYIDYDRSNAVIREGDNTDRGEERMAAERTVGAAIVSFTCVGEPARKAQYLEVATEVDYRTLGRFYADPRPVSEIAAPTSAQAGRPIATATAMQAGQRYKSCALTAAQRFALSGEAAPVVADAALAACAAFRRNLALAFSADPTMGTLGTETAISSFDHLLHQQLQFEVVRQRAKR